jgi:hypothetical protein
MFVLPPDSGFPTSKQWRQIGTVRRPRLYDGLSGRETIPTSSNREYRFYGLFLTPVSRLERAGAPAFYEQTLPSRPGTRRGMPASNLGEKLVKPSLYGLLGRCLRKSIRSTFFGCQALCRLRDFNPSAGFLCGWVLVWLVNSAMTALQLRKAASGRT